MLLLPNTRTLFYLTAVIIVTQALSSQQAGQYAPLFQFAVSCGICVSFHYYAVNFGCLCIVYINMHRMYKEGAGNVSFLLTFT